MSVDRAVLLYGSHARGDYDSVSDIDVLVVGTWPPPAEELAALLPPSCKGTVHTSHYTWPEFEAMSRYGSLFVHHIAAEALPIRYDGNGQARMSTLLSSLGWYQLAERDLLGFRTTVSDVEGGLRLGLPPCFELAVLGGVARHASVLACYIAGSPSYGRNSIVRATALLEMPGARGYLELAHRFRLAEEGQCPTPTDASRMVAARIAETLYAFLDRLEGLVHADAA